MLRLIIPLLLNYWLPYSAAPGAIEFHPPIPGIISSAYGLRTHPLAGSVRHHHGIDIAAAPGVPVRAARDGVVKQVGWQGGYGLLVEVDHHFFWSTRYAHLSGAAVQVGDALQQGQVLGFVGATGAVTGPHLHFEVHYRQATLNPLLWLARQDVSPRTHAVLNAAMLRRALLVARNFATTIRR